MISLDFLWLEITRKCNLRCTHCYADADPSVELESAMSLGDWKRLLADGRKLGCHGVQFIGGEVLLVRPLEALVAEACTLGYSSIEVFTNATAVTTNTIRYFQTYGVRVATSFYSCDAEVHDGITRKIGSWRRTLRALDKLREAGLPIRVGVIALPQNEQTVEDTISFIRGRGIDNVVVDQVRSIGRAKVLAGNDDYLETLCGQCGRGRLCVTYDGDILPCIMARETPLGNFLQAGGLEEAITWSALHDFRKALVTTKERSSVSSACTPHCWPHGGCGPHDTCKPTRHDAELIAELENNIACTPHCWPHGGCGPHDTCKPDRGWSDADSRIGERLDH
jgi:MoaA/NifB/PqqE/SkfB family radical SAM enzyme